MVPSTAAGCPRTHHDPTISQLLAELQILAGVADVHRSQVGQ